jgi:putative flippase GtrA
VQIFTRGREFLLVQPVNAQVYACPRSIAQSLSFDDRVGGVPYALSVSAPTSAPAERRSGIRSLLARFEHLFRELGKFGVVGTVAFVVDISIYNTLLTLYHLETVLSGAISMVVAATVAFFGNRFWTWRDRERSGLRREYLLYFMFNLVGLVIGLSCLAISHYGLGSVWPALQSPLADNVAKNLVGMAFGTVFRFWAYRQIVFRAIPEDRS